MSACSTAAAGAATLGATARATPQTLSTLDLTARVYGVGQTVIVSVGLWVTTGDKVRGLRCFRFVGFVGNGLAITLKAPPEVIV